MSRPRSPFTAFITSVVPATAAERHPARFVSYVKAAVCLMLCLIGLFLPMASGEEATATLRWKSHQERLRETPGLVWLYSFEDFSPQERVSASLGGNRDLMRFEGRTPPAVIAGRDSAAKAISLDADPMRTTAIPADQGFTVEVVFRKLGQGKELGNGRTNGAVFAQGNGYWEGFRVWCDYPDMRIHFEIGRPQPQNAVGITGAVPLPDSAWHHVAAVWDTREMRLYWNGILIAAGEYSGPYTPPKTAGFTLGFADAGIGSLQMEVDELAGFSRPLSPAEILAHALWETVPTGPAAERLVKAADAAARRDWQTMRNEFTAAAEAAPNTPAAAGAKFGAALARRLQGRLPDACAEFVALMQDPQVPALLRDGAARMLVVQMKNIHWASAPLDVYQALLTQQGWSEEDRQILLDSAAEAAFIEGKSRQAEDYYRQLAALKAQKGLPVWEVGLQLAHCSRAQGDWDTARARYREIADDAKAPAELRSLALLGWASTYELSEDFTAAKQAYERIAADARLIPLHRWEAQEAASAMDRAARGLPRRDPAEHRTRVDLPQPATRLYVAPDGDDSAPGTADQPLATLEGARDAVRRLKAGSGLPEGGIAVIIRGGIYPRTAAWELEEQDSGEDGRPVIYQAGEGEKPIFTGGVVLRGFSLVQDPKILARLPENARGKVVRLDLAAAGVRDYGEIQKRGFGLAGYPANPWVDLYINDVPATLARRPNDGFVKTRAFSTPLGEQGRASPAEFEIDPEPAAWSADDLWLFGYWRYLWAGHTIRVDRIDPQTRRLKTAMPSNYGFAEGMPYYFFNALEAIDAPGEWYLDRKAGTLYVYPPVDLSQAEVKFPVLARSFVHMRNTSHVVLRGLTFECGRAEGVVVEGGRNVLLAGCTLARLGTNGAVLLGGMGHGVLGCDLLTLGAGGVIARGGDVATLTPGGFFVENCHVQEFTRVDRNYAPAVNMDGVGNVIRHNLFHDSPHHGIRLGGFDHLVELNEIHSVVYESDDQSGIDMFGDPVIRGNVLRYNFWHHIGSGHSVAGQAGIRLDDMISGVWIYGNVFYRAAGGQFGGLQIHGGKDNIADNNLFIACKQAVSFSPWGANRWQERVAEWLQAAEARGLDVNRPPFSERFPELRDLASNPDRNFLLRNLVISCGDFAVRDRGVNVYWDNHAYNGDVGFVDPKTRQFGLRSDSPIFRRYVFRPIPFEEIGLYKDEFRASWPVHHEVSPKYVREP